MEEKEFSFENPVILLFGENHRGKSSTLNAIEWCLFGSECIGATTGIRERINWEIRNRNLRSDDPVFVELELTDESNNTYKVLRKLVSKTKDDLEITLPDGQKLKEEIAIEKLSHLLKSSFRDFLTTVYQHQEAIRAILTQEPKDRNDAIDRLLGLSDYRNILSGINSAEINKKFETLNKNFQKFVEKQEGVLQTREKDIKEKRDDLIKNGINEEMITKEGAFEIAKRVNQELLNFASDAGLTFTSLTLPEDWKELKKFAGDVQNVITNFRSRLPDENRQKELFNKKSQITLLKSEYETKNKKIKTIKEEIDRFIKENGDTEKLNIRKSDIEKKITQKEKKMNEISAKGKTISDAIDYLKLEGVDK
ncbi:MAG: AAA family ATPase, partial [candidate division WOR-3 bacterium]